MASGIGLYNPEISRFYLRDSLTGGVANASFIYGTEVNAWIALAGDWNNHGDDTIGLYDPDTGKFYLNNELSGGTADIAFRFGPDSNAGWTPITGDWYGSGGDTVGLYDPATGTFYLENDFDGGNADIKFRFGPNNNAGWQAISGDWDGDGEDGIGLYNPTTGRFYLKDDVEDGNKYADFNFRFGPNDNAGWLAIAGDWDDDGDDSIGLYNPSTGKYYLSDDIGDKVSTDHVFRFGPDDNAGWQPIVGDWEMTPVDDGSITSTFTLQEAYAEDVIKTVVTSTTSTEVEIIETPIITTDPLDPILEQHTYWRQADGFEAPVEVLWKLIEDYLSPYLVTNFRDLGLYDINESLAQIANITLAGAGDIVQGEGVSGEGVVGEDETGDIIDNSSIDYNAGDDINDTGDNETNNIIEGEDGKEGDYTGDYTLTVTLSDGTINNAIIALSAAQFEFINGLLGDQRFVERDVEIYSYMPLLAKDPDTGELLTDADGNYIPVLDVDGNPIPVKAYDYKVSGESTHTEVIDGETVEVVEYVTEQNMVPIILTPTVNNGGSIETGFTSAEDDLIRAGRLDILHQAYIDGGDGYNTLEVDAKGTYAQPLALYNIDEVHVQNLPNVYTTAGDGDGYLGDSVYPDLSSVAATVAEVIDFPTTTNNIPGMVEITSLSLLITGTDLNSGAVFELAPAEIPAGSYTAVELAAIINAEVGDDIATVDGLSSVAANIAEVIVFPEDTVDAANNPVKGTITISSLTLLVTGDNGFPLAPVVIPAGVFTAADLADLINEKVGGSVTIASVDTITGDLKISTNTTSAQEIIFTGDQVGEFGLSGIANDGVLTVGGNVIINTNATTAQEIRFDGDQVEEFGLSGIANDGTLTIPARFADSILDLSSAIDIEKLVITESWGSDGYLDTDDLALGNLLVVGVRNGATLRFEGAFEEDVTVHYGEGRSDDEPLTVELILGEVRGELNVAHNTDSLHLVSLGGGSNTFGTEDLGGSLSDLIITGNANLHINNDLDSSFKNETPVTIDASGLEDAKGVAIELNNSEKVTIVGSREGDDVFDIDTGNPETYEMFEYVNIDGGNGSNQYDINTYKTAITNGVGNNTYRVNVVNLATITSADGNNTYDVTAENAEIVSGDGDNSYTVTAVEDATISSGNGENTYDVTANEDATITSGNGENSYTVNADTVEIVSGNGDKYYDIEHAENVTITAGDGNADTFRIDASESVTINVGDGDSNYDIDGTASGVDVSITTGTGNNNFIVGEGDHPDDDPFGTVTIVTGDGNNTYQVDAAQEAHFTAGNGKNVFNDSTNGDGTDAIIMTVDFGDGDNRIVAEVVDFTATVGDGDNRIDIEAYDAPESVWELEDDLETAINITAGDGANQINLYVNEDNQAGDQYAGHFLQPAEINITAGDGGNTIQIPIATTWDQYQSANSGDPDGLIDETLPLLTTINIATGTGDDNIFVGASDITITSIAGNNEITLIGTDSDYVSESAMLDINTGTGSTTINLGAYTDPAFLNKGTITAKEGSSIQGTDITLFVNTAADLRAVNDTDGNNFGDDLSMVTSVILDDDYMGSYTDSPEANDVSSKERATLTLTDKQLTSIGAENFSVEGSIFYTHAYVKLIITDSTSLTELGVDNLSRNIDLELEIQDGATLTMTAQQLHERVAPQGVTLANDGNDGNTDLLSGKVIITGANGVDMADDPYDSVFDPFNVTDYTDYGADADYIGGSISEDFLDSVTGEYQNVIVDAIFNGYSRPVDIPSADRFTIDSENGPVSVPSFSTPYAELEIKGDNDVTFTGALTLGESDDPLTPNIDETEKFMVDFSQLEARVIDFTLAEFQDVEAIRGNSLNYNATVYVKINGEDSDARTIGSEGHGLDSRGVEQYVVVDISDDNNKYDDSEDAIIWLCDATQDLETITLRGNYDATLTVEDAQSGLIFELEGDGRSTYPGAVPKSAGPQATSNVGNLVVNFLQPDSVANIEINNQDTDTSRSLHVAGITLSNAITVNINVEDANAIIESLMGAETKDLDIEAVGNVLIEGDLPASLTTIDASDVVGTFTAMFDGHPDATTTVDDAISFIGAQSGSFLTLEDMAEGDAEAHSIDGGIGGVELTIQDEVDLSAATLANITAIELNNNGGTPGDAALLTLTVDQFNDLDDDVITLADGTDTGSLELLNLNDQDFDSTTIGAGVDVDVTMSEGTWTLGAVDLSNVSQFDMSGAEVTMTAQQMIQLAESLAANGTDPAVLFTADENSVININGLTQADADWSIDFDGQTYTFSQLLAVISSNNFAGTVTLAESVNLTDSSGDILFDFILGEDMTLGLATAQQADGLAVTGGDNSAIDILFNELTVVTDIDASEFDVTTLMFQDWLVFDQNVDAVFTGLNGTIIKDIYNNAVVLIDQTVTVAAGTTVRGDLILDRLETDMELEDVVFNLQGGTVIDGEINLAAGDKDEDLIQTYLKTVTINSLGTDQDVNLRTGDTANIINGVLTTLTSGATPEDTNELLDVTIHAEQDLVLSGGIDFASLINDDETASLTVDGTADVTVGALDITDSDVDGLNVVNNGTGTLTVTLDGGMLVQDDALSFTGPGAITLNINNSVDLTDDDLDSVTHVTFENGAAISLTMAQADVIGADHFALADGATAATLNLSGLDGEAFAIANYEDGIDVGLVTIADIPVVTLHDDTDLTGIAMLEVPEGTILNMTAAQYQQLTDAGTIEGIDSTTDFTVNITDLTQADADTGFDLSGITADNLTLALFENVELIAADATADPVVVASDLNGADITIGDFTFTLYDVLLANALNIKGTAGSTLAFTDLTGFLVHIDASGFDFDTLRLPNALVSGNNVDYMFEGLSGDIIKVIFNGIGDVEGKEQTVVIEAGTTIFSDVSFNDYLLDQEVTHLTVNLQGGVELDGSLVVSTVDVNGAVVELVPFYLQELVINSSGTVANHINGETANVITGNITPAAYANAIGVGSRDNNLKSVTIDADQALMIEGDILFSSHGTDTDAPLNNQPDDGITANDDDAAIATLTVTGSEDVTIGGLNTTDDDIDGLNVINNGTGTLSLTIDAAKIDDATDNVDVLSFTGSNIDLTVVGAVDLSDDFLTGVSQLTIAEDAILTLSQSQFDTLGALNLVNGDTDSTVDELLHLVEVTGAFDSSTVADGIDVVSLTLAGDVDFSTTASDFTGVDSIIVPEGATLTLTAAQYQQLQGSGMITGLDVDDDGTVGEFFVNITDLTQADIDIDVDENDVADGLVLTGIGDQATVVLSLAEDVNLNTITDLDDLGRLSVTLADGQTLGLASSTQADGLVISGGTDTTVVYRFDSLDGADLQIDASGYVISTLEAMDRFFFDDGANNSGEENAEFIIQNLPGGVGGVTLVVFNDPADLDIPAYSRTVIINEGVTVPGEFVFNDVNANRELINLDITLSGDSEIDGDLRLPTVNPGTNMAQYFDTLTINSLASATSTANTIDGDITAEAMTPANPASDAEMENNLLTIDINAQEDLVVTGDVVFTSVNADSDDATANLTITGTAAVSLGDLDTSDTDVDALNVVNNSAGNLSATVNAATIDAPDVLSFTGTGAIDLTIVGDVNLSDDTLTAVDTITIAEDATLTLSQAQFDILGALNLFNGDTDSVVDEVLHLVEVTGAFDATTVADGIDVVSLTLAGDVDFSTTASDFTDVDSIIVPEGSTLTLTAAQYQQLLGAGSIVGIDASGAASIDYTVNITDLTQADIDLTGGFDISGVTADQINLTLAEDVNLSGTTNLGDLTELQISLADGQTLGLSTMSQFDGLNVDGGTLTAVELQFATGFDLATTYDASGIAVDSLRVLNDLVTGHDVELLQNISSDVDVVVYMTLEAMPGYIGSTNRVVIIEEGVTVDSFLVFNDYQNDQEVITLTMTFQGDATVNDYLGLSTVAPASPLIARNFQLLTIYSEGDDVNTINGDIDPMGGVNYYDSVSIDNNMFAVVINAAQDFDVTGSMIFNGLTDADDSATLTVSGVADVTIGNLDTLDTEIVNLTVNHTGDGALTFGLNAANIDVADDLTLSGSATGTTTIAITGDVDLSDNNGDTLGVSDGNDTLSNIDVITIADNSVLTLTTTQYNAVGAFDGTGTASDIVIQDYNGEVINLIPDTDEISIVLEIQDTDGGTVVLDLTSFDLSQVTEIKVPLGTTLQMTADQFESMADAPVITGAGTLNLVNFDSDNGDIDVTGVDAVHGSITLDAGAAEVLVNVAAELDSSSFSFAMSANDQVLTLSTEEDADGVEIDSGAFTGTELLLGFISSTPMIAGVASGTAGDGTMVASGWDVENVRLLDDYITAMSATPGIDYNYEERLVDLSGDVTIVVEPQIPGNTDSNAVNSLIRNIIIREDADVDADTIFDDNVVDTDDYVAVKELNLTMEGNATLNGDVSIPTDNTVAGQIYLDTLSITSTGSENTITGNITAGVSGADSENTLTDVNILANADFVVGTYGATGWASGGDIVFTAAEDSQAATLDIEGSANVTIHGVDITDVDDGDNYVGDIDSLTITNNAGTFTMTGGTAAVVADNAEGLYLAGSGDMVFGNNDEIAGATASEGVASTTLSVINASGLTGNLALNEIAVDSEAFVFTAGTGVTTLTVDDDLTDDGDAATTESWTFDMSLATGASELHLPANTYAASDLTINLGAAATLYIDGNTDFSALDNLNITQTQAIVLADGATLTLTAAQANGLNIVAGPEVGGDGFDGVVNIVGLANNTGEVHFEGIADDIAGTITLGENDVEVDAGTNLGDFSVTLVDVNPATDANDIPLAGQVVRFNTEAQAARQIIVDNDNDITNVSTGENDSDSDVDTSVVWLFTELDDPAVPVNTDAYSADLGRLWLNPTLANGANIESLFTNLNDAIIRVEFSGLTELEAELAASTGFDRVVELVAFTDLQGGLDFSDEELLTHIKTLTVEMGGNVVVGNIMLDNVIDPVTTNPITFDGEVTINSRLMNNEDHYLAPEEFDDATHELPTLVNEIGDIGIGANGDSSIDLLTVNVDTGVTADDDENGVTIQTITFDSDTAATIATFKVTGDQAVTVKSLDTSDGDITTLTVDTTGYAGSLTVTGGSPAAAVANTETLTITMGEEGVAANVVFGSPDTSDGIGEYAGVSGPILSEINISGGTGNTLDLGVVAQIDGDDFVVNGDNDVATTMTLGQANVDGAELAPELLAAGIWNIDLGNHADSELTIVGNTDFGAGDLTLNAPAIIISGDVDFTALTDLTVTHNSFEVPVGASLTIRAEHANALHITGDGLVTVTELESTLNADLSDIMTTDGDTGTVEALVTTDAAADVDFLGDLGKAHVIVSGDGTFDVMGATLDSIVFDHDDDPGTVKEIVMTTFTVNTGSTLELAAAQVDDRTANGPGTTELILNGAPADVNLADITTDVVNAAVNADAAFNEDADFGTAVITVADTVILTVIGETVDTLTVNGEGTVLVDSADLDGDTIEDAINADFSNFGIEFITFDADALVDSIDFPELYGDPTAIPAEAVQTVSLTSVQADGQTIVGVTPGVTGSVLVAIDDTVDADIDGDVDAFNLSLINAGTMTATINDTDNDDVVFDGAVDFGAFDIVVTAGDAVTMTAAQADGLSITETGAATITVTDLEAKPDAVLSGVVLANETAQLDANGGVPLSADLGEGFTVVVTDSSDDGLTDTVTFTGTMVSNTTTFTLGTEAADNVALELDAADASFLTVAEGVAAATTAVVVNNLGGDMVNFTTIVADTLTANVPVDVTLDPGSLLGDFDVALDDGVDLGLTFTQLMAVGLEDFSSVAGVPEETLIVSDYLPGTLIDSSVLLPDLAMILHLKDTNTSLLVNANTDFTGVEEIVIPEDTTLTMTADQFQEIQTSVTVSGLGTLNLTKFDNENNDIDLSSVTAQAGTITLDAAAGEITATAPELAVTDPIVLDPLAVLDNQAGDKFSILMSVNNQAITFSTEFQADGRAVEEGAFTGNAIVLGFTSADALGDLDANMAATDFNVDNVYVLNQYLANEFGGVTPANIEEMLTDLDSGIAVTIYDVDSALTGGLVNPDVVESTIRVVNVESNTFVDASVAFNDLRDGTEVTELTINLNGNSVINGSLTLPQDVDPMSLLPVYYVDLFGGANGLTINSVNTSGTALTAVNQIDGDIIANTALGGSESQVESFTIDFAGVSIVGSQEQVEFAGVVINDLDDGDGALEVATAVAVGINNAFGALAQPLWYATDNADGTVTFTALSAGDVTDVTVADFAFTQNDGSTVLADAITAGDITFDQQGSFAAGENNLLNVDINASYELDITGTLEFSYVAGSLEIDDTADTTTTAYLNVAGAADVTIGVVDYSDEHLSGLTYTHIGAGHVTATGLSPAFQSTTAETLVINENGTGAGDDLVLGTGPDGVRGGGDDNTGVYGDDLSLIDVNGQGQVDLGILEMVDPLLFTLDASDDNLGTTANSVVTATVGADLAVDGIWIFTNGGDTGTEGLLNLTIDGTTATFGGGTSSLSILNANLDFIGAVDFSALATLVLTGTTISIVSPASLTLTCAQADGMAITGDGTLILVGDELDAHDFSNLNVENIDMSGITSAENDNVVLNLGAHTTTDFNITGSDFDDTITTSDGADTIDGGLGDDVITGGAGIDDLNGEAGDDILAFASAAELLEDATVEGGADTDTIRMDTAAAALTLVDTDFVNVATVENLDLTGTGVQQVTLGANTDAAFANGITLTTDITATGLNLDGSLSTVAIDATGTDNNDTLTGGTVADTLTGNAGDDIITGGAGADTLDGGAGDDVFVVSAIADLADSEVVNGGANTGGVDTLRLDASGTLTNAQLDGTLDGVEVVSLNNDDTDWSLTFADAAFTNADADGDDTTDATITVSAAIALTNNVLVDASTAIATSELVVDGANLGGNDTLSGGAGADTIDGGAGDDTITGAAGVDSLTGGAGSDLFVVAATADLADGEVVNGGANTGGVDTLRLDGSGAFTNAQLDGTLDGVEVVSLNNDDTDWSLTFADAAFTNADADGDDTTDATITVSAAMALTNDVLVDASAAGATSELVVDGTNLGGNDTLSGGAGDDTIDGGAGDDTITGAAGDDSLVGGLGADVFVYADATEDVAGDTINGTNEQATDDTIRMDGSGVYDFTGFANITNIDQLSVNADTATTTITLDDGVVGTADANNDGVAGDIEIINGTGAAITNVTNIDASALTGSNAINVSATDFDGADAMTGGAGDDTINGGAGNDTITGSGGADSLYGNDDDDTFIFADAAALAAVTIVDGGAGTDTVQVDGTTLVDLNFANYIGVENLYFSADAAHSITMGPNTNAAFVTGINITTVNGGATTLDVQGALSTVAIDATGTDQADTLVGGSADDTFSGGGDVDIITGNEGSDNMVGGAGNDIFIIDAAADHAAGEIITGDGDTDVIRFTSISGETLTLTAGVEVDEVRIADASGVDTGITNENIDAALAVGAIDIYGNDGGNDLIGNSSNNLISGGDGDDTITGGDGDDVLTGGNGIDTFVFSDDGTGNNISITDWGVEAGDVLSGALSAGDVLDVTFGASGATVNPAPAVTPGNLGLDGAVIFDATYDVGDQITLTVGGQVLNHTVALGATSGNAVVADFVNTMNNIIDLELNTGDMDLGSLAGSASVDGGNPNKLIITNDNTGDGAFTVTAATVNSNSVTFDASGIAATNGTVDVTGGGTDDIITGGAGDDTIDGLMGADVINGGDGADIITGDGGIDTIDGGDGADNIDGGYGGDDLTGGAGDDTFTYTKDTHDGDTIHDFNTAGDDHFAFDADASDLFRSAITGGNLHIITGVAGGSALLQTAGTAGSVALANLFGGTTGFANKAAFLSALTGITNGVAINSEYVAFALSTGGSNLWVAQASESIGINTNDIDSASVIMTIGINSSANVQAADIVII